MARASLGNASDKVIKRRTTMRGAVPGFRKQVARRPIRQKAGFAGKLINSANPKMKKQLPVGRDTYQYRGTLVNTAKPTRPRKEKIGAKAVL